MIHAECVIIGAGFAGAATAYHLTRLGLTDILLLEQETIPGYHSSGRNAAMIRQCISDQAVARLARDGAAFLRNVPEDWEPVQFKRNGSLLLGKGEGLEKLKRDADGDRKLGVNVELWTPEQARKHVPVLKEADFDGAIWSESDGVIDIHALLSGYLKAATTKGARIRYGAKVETIRKNGDGRLHLTVNGGESIGANVVVNACGAWANTVAKLAGAETLPLRPCRRHLFVSPPLDWVDVRWPFVWDVSHDIYFRPEGQGLLLCACDECELQPGDPPVDPGIEEVLAEKIQRFIPALSSVSINKYWAGFRTLSIDGRFAIGWDPKVEHFFWVAGLGGHGVTTSSAVGALAADVIVGKSNDLSEAFSPKRFAV
jgi:D-arginine dehydrogenase